MIESHHDLIVDAHLTVGADNNYDTADFVAGCRERGFTPHVVQNTVNAMRHLCH